MNVISFSLWGDSPKYIQGMLTNIALAREYYPGWVCRVYVSFHTAASVFNGRNPAEKHGGEWGIIPLAHPLEKHGMFWRFLAGDDPRVERFLVRDADSRIGPEEAACCQKWIEEDTVLWTARAHPAHARPINGGMWGMMPRRANWEAPKMADLIQEYLASDDYKNYKGHDHDQHFLCTRVWPWAKASATQHDNVCRGAFPGSKPFPVKWKWPRFMGEVFEVNADGTEQPRDGDWQAVPKV